ncbi:hypothetical protein [Kineosporia sp. NBRC 101731]|uniref:hypothetical protein n=1 Tax=Kineosporia sp. NBRC 101731 TaxID=3032199 RepID=UPI0024A52ADC|nr:hypothetical protein [Kineosporia sp. NBRC 101731]GLY29097.1 hypothetical protein Kisp02_24620 [Kineosporia sp. NBRC 101731]
MADSFGVDVRVAEEMARHLADIRTSFNDLQNIFGSQGGVTGSSRVQSALDDFASESSDVRKKLDESLERAAGMLSGLATGAGQLDTGLADAVTVDPAQVAATSGSAP